MTRLCLLTAFLACSVAGLAAASLHRVQGSVVDRTGAPLPDVRIVVRDVRGRPAASTESDQHGEFTLELPEGRYSLRAAVQGFSPVEEHTIAVGPGFAPRVDLVMQMPAMEHQVVVTANRTETPLSQVGSSVTVLSGERMRQEAIVWVADALRRVPGLTVAQSGGYGQLASLFTRGGESDYTKVLIDGIPANDPGGAFNFSMLPIAGIDRIEIVRGPQSALFGSDAISGVVQLFTARGSSEAELLRFSSTVEAGSYSSFRYSGALRGRGKSWDYAASFSRADTDGDVPNGSFNNETVSATAGTRISQSTGLRLVLRTDAGRAGVPGPWAFHRPEQDEYFRERRVLGGISLTHQSAPLWTQTLAYSVSDSRQLSVDPGDSGSFVSQYEGRTAPFISNDYPFQTLNQSRRHRVSYQSDFVAARGHLLSAGADYERESGLVGDPEFQPLHAARNNLGAFVQDQYSRGDRVFAAAGVRLEHNESFGFYAAPRLSAAIHLHRPDPANFLGLTNIKANFGIGIKAPTLLESFSNSPFFLGNPDLRPERSTSFDAGLEQYFASGRGRVEFTYFDNRFRDQIGFAITDFASFEGSFFNIGRTLARGLESSVLYPLPRSLEISAAYTFLHSRVLESAVTSDPAFSAGQELFRRPRHSGHFEIRWSPGRWRLSAAALAVGRRVDSDFSGLGLGLNPGYGTLNLSADYRFSERFSCYAAVNNALNRAYMDVLGFPALGAHFRVGLRTAF